MRRQIMSTVKKITRAFKEALGFCVFKGIDFTDQPGYIMNNVILTDIYWDATPDYIIWWYLR
jgi:hypothetical protein